MCNQSDHIILSKSDSNQISWCKVCRNHSLIFGNCCIALNNKEFQEMKTVLLGLCEQDFQKISNEQKQVILKNRNSNVGLVLKKHDITQLIELFDEARVMKEAFSIIYDF